MTMIMMKHCYLIQIQLIAAIACAFISASYADTVRTFSFDAQVKYLPLLRSLPNHTAIYHEWPPKNLRKTLPDYIAAAVVSPDKDSGDSDDLHQISQRLIGPPIHVQAGDTLSVTLKNSLPTTGLSLHWHGFEMSNALEYDGVVGVTQCPISPNTQFIYEFEVDETPGTYWWHTHSGTLGVHATNSIHGPLIVHPKGEEMKQLVDKLNGIPSPSNDTDTAIDSIESRWYYDNERILFFKDGFLEPEALGLANKLGGLNEAVSKDDSGHTVSSQAWEYGTCNGRMREIVPVSPGRSYKFRLINGGSHYGLRINIADLKMNIIASDSEPVEPIQVDEVFLHAAERFDVEVTIPDDWAVGQSFWIRADTVESAHQGYQNGIRAILKVASGDYNDASEQTYDPVSGNIRSPVERSPDHLTMNCFNRKTFERTPHRGTCLPITALSHEQSSISQSKSYVNEDEAKVHFIDSHWQPTPQNSHFIRFDDGPYLQHVNPMKSMLDPSFTPEDMHPNAAVLHVPSYSTILMVWRTTSLMDHPMHLHGLKMEIIDIALPNKRKDCSLSKCKLNTFYDSHEHVKALAAGVPPNTAVLKDTFVIPAGGAVVTRIHTQEPNLWYAHCHIEVHHFDGMAFILNVGNYSSSESERVLPDDYPVCNSPFLQAKRQYPSCDCYENPNAVLSTYLTAEYKCSRDHLCHHVFSRAANLERYPFDGGDDIHSSYELSGYLISLISIALICFILGSFRYRKKVADNARCGLIALRNFITPPGKPSSDTKLECSKQECTNSKDKESDEPSTDSKEDSFSIDIGIVDIGTTAHSRKSVTFSLPETDDIGTTTHSHTSAISPDEDAELTDANDPFTTQMKVVLKEQYKVYTPLCVNFLRVIEVCSLAMLTGFLYYDVGNNSSYTGLSQRLGLFFFSCTLWTFTRMYPSVGFSHQWRNSSQANLEEKKFSFGPIVSGRMLIVLGLESFWPLIYVLVCYPFAGVFGSLKIVVQVGLFLLLNNLCYVSLGSMLGVYSKRVPQGMIASTIFSQTSLVAAGFYTKLPPALDWIRYISPFYWTFRGILKSCFKWNDTLECFKGSSEVGANQCYLEYHAAIDQYKSRGINVATYNDPSSNSIFLESVALVLLLVFLNSLIFAKFWYISKRLEKQIETEADAEADCSQSKKTDFRSQMKRQSTFIKYFGDIYPSTE